MKYPKPEASVPENPRISVSLKSADCSQNRTKRFNLPTQYNIDLVVSLGFGKNM